MFNNMQKQADQLLAVSYPAPTSKQGLCYWSCCLCVCAVCVQYVQCVCGVYVCGVYVCVCGVCVCCNLGSNLTQIVVTDFLKINR